MGKNSDSPLVVLLMDDVKSAQKISLHFREIGVIPCFFRELKTFWYAIIKERPILAIIDVKKMSDGHYLLKDHPLIASQSLPMAFFYNQDSKPLLTSTHDFLHYGLLEENSPYELMLKVIFQRVLKNEKSKLEMNHLQEKLKVSKLKYEQLQNNLEIDGKNQQTFDSLLLKMAKSLGQIATFDKFFDFLADTLTDFSDIHEFSLVSLDKSGLKLISPDLLSSKFRPIPDLKLGQISEMGIEFFAQNMVLEVALELLGDQFVPIHLYGRKKNPDHMIFLKVSDKGKESYSWKIFESVINSVYSRIVLFQGELKQEKNSEVKGPWNLLGHLENNEKNRSFIQIDFMALFDFVRSGINSNFYWEVFYKDFINHLGLDLDFPIEIIPMGLDQLVIGIDKKNDKKFKEVAELFIKQFQYQGYFQGGVANDLAIKLRPQIWEVPSSANEYLKLI